MNAEIVSVGTELLLGQIIDTHAPRMAGILADCGISCQRRATVGDNFDRLVGALKESLSRADIVVTIGGLGPTVDDLTRDAIAVALDDTLEVVPEMAEKLTKFFASHKINMSQTTLRQADKPTCAEFIDNPNGTAPGLLCRKNGKTVIALPGPKGEFDPMADGPVRTYLETVEGGSVIHSRVLRICNMGESAVEDAIRPLMDNTNPTVAPYAHVGEVHLRVTARAKDREEGDKLIDPVEAEIRSILGTNVFGVDATSLEAAIINLLVSRGETVAVAESMTGGELAARFSMVAGSSKAFTGGVVTYTIGAKQQLLGIELTDGPVSESTARLMAAAVREKLSTTYGISVTGNAGPTPDVDNKPVGMVFLGLATPTEVTVREGKYRGIRTDIRRRACQVALTTLRDYILARA